MQDNNETPQDPLLSPLSAFKPITRLKSYQDSKGEVQSVIHEEVQVHVGSKLKEFLG